MEKEKQENQSQTDGRREPFDKMIDQLARSTRSPHGRFSADESWPLLKARLQMRRRRRRVWMRVAASAAVVVFCVAGWAAYRALIPSFSRKTELEATTPASPRPKSVQTLKFRQERLEVVARRLSEVYETPVCVEDDSLKDYRVTATFRTDEPLPELLEVLRRATENFSCLQRGDTLFLIPTKK